MTRLLKQKAKLEKLLAGIGAFNAKSRTAEITAFIDQYIPAVERMYNLMKKYQVVFTETTVENKKLKQHMANPMRISHRIIRRESADCKSALYLQ